MKTQKDAGGNQQRTLKSQTDSHLLKKKFNPCSGKASAVKTDKTEYDCKLAYLMAIAG
nr:hypothetical protein [Mucilaginibacter sp. L294]